MWLSTLPTVTTLLLASLVLSEHLKLAVPFDLSSLGEGEHVAEGSGLWTEDIPIPPEEGAKIPGNNPLYLCSAEQDDDIVEIEELDLAPNPPKRGQQLVTTFSGTISRVIDKRSFVHVQVKLAGTRIINKQYDLCWGLKYFGQSCPFREGYISTSKDVKIDKSAPKGNYLVRVRVATAENDQITCFTGWFEL